MKKPADQAAAETAVRNAAADLKTAIDNARELGLSVQFPTNHTGLDGIAVSETRRASVVTTVIVDPTAPNAPAPETIAKAETAAQVAADKVVTNSAKG